MDNANDVNTVLKSSAVEKDFAQKAPKRSIFSNNATIALPEELDNDISRRNNQKQFLL